MEIETDDSVIQSCLKRIEEQLGWGSGDEWSTQDFESLSKKIQDTTGVTLSVATLKRIWGKIRYESKPTITTLNTLAQFIGFENWRTFKHSHSLNGVSNSQGTPSTIPVSPKSKNWKPLVGIALGIIAVGVVYYYLNSNQVQHSAINPELFAFSSKKVVDAGVPNTVIFDYDATAATETDSVFIQQSWDKRLSTCVNRNQHQHTSIYYYPGFFAAKLRINGMVVREHNLVINTNGWIPLIEQKPVPVYFKETDARYNGSLGLSLQQINESHVPLQPQPPRVAYFNVGDFGEVTTADLVLETQLKNDYAEGANACQFSEVSILFEGGALVIPLSSKGCVSELSFMDLDGKKSDLSVLGCDFSNWVDLKVEFQPDTFKVFIANRSLKFPLQAKPIRMVGVAFKFQGTGSINNLTISNHGGEIFYKEEFE